MSELRTIHYDDGRWCEQEYVNEKLHGRWTVFFANGQKDWERQCSNGRQEGYQRKWDEAGRLIEEQWYHLGQLHGLWRTWDDAGNVHVVGDFFHGYPREAFQTTVNEDFNSSIKPYFGLEPVEWQKQIETFIAGVSRKTARIRKGPTRDLDLSEPGSFWNHVNVRRANEEWPASYRKPLHPILQIRCADIPPVANVLADLSFVTLFAAADDVLHALGEDIVVRAYRRNERLVAIEAPCEPLDTPSTLVFSEILSYPDENDLPSGLCAYLEDAGDTQGVLAQDEKLNSRVGGWPGWLQSGRLSSFGKFAFQVDSLDVENWGCGDCTIHYFFLSDKPNQFIWQQEMC
jgi:hypothetical protein